MKTEAIPITDCPTCPLSCLLLDNGSDAPRPCLDDEARELADGTKQRMDVVAAIDHYGALNPPIRREALHYVIAKASNMA